MDAQVKTRVKLHTWIAFDQCNIFLPVFLTDQTKFILIDHEANQFSFTCVTRQGGWKSRSLNGND